jgi:hypothetical protein
MKLDAATRDHLAERLDYYQTQTSAHLPTTTHIDIRTVHNADYSVRLIKQEFREYLPAMWHPGIHRYKVPVEFA